VDREAEFAFDLGLVSRRWRTRLDARFKAMGLTQARWIALLELSRSGPISQRELADRLGVEGPTIVRLLDGLERGGLVERRGCEDDRRLKRIHLTERSEAMLTTMKAISDALRRELLAGIAADDLDAALRVLRTISARLEGP
jgi:MarR family transcriptional regulator for hemolysin